MRAILAIRAVYYKNSLMILNASFLWAKISGHKKLSEISYHIQCLNFTEWIKSALGRCGWQRDAL